MRTKRPLSITIVGWLFIAVGITALLYHLMPLMPQHSGQPGFQPPSDSALAWIALVRITATVCGVFILWGYNWARWLLVVWIAYHVYISALHSAMEVVVHGLLFGILIYVLFRPNASAFFRDRRAIAPEVPGPESV